MNTNIQRDFQICISVPLSINSFWIASKPVDNKPEFIEITSRFTFQNIPMHEIEFSTLNSTKYLFLGISSNFQKSSFSDHPR